MQKLVLTGGGGLAFDAVVSPIADGVVQVKGPASGGAYRFTSRLAQPAKGTLSGVGEVEIEEMSTKVQVELDRYRQPAGPGSPLSFESADMARRGIYVEFTGTARSEQGQRYAFRVNLGATKAGSGQVEPASADFNANMMAKSVVITAPATTALVSLPVATTVQPVP